jgi:predicted unusual protein kinase regulating ubiquinone biosynthesis (AarF/ABC1/UbiB family)
LEEFDEARFVREASHLVALYNAYDQSTSISEGSLLMELVQVGISNNLRPPPELAFLAKALLNLESVTVVLNPSMNTRDVVAEHLNSVMKKIVVQKYSL